MDFLKNKIELNRAINNQKKMKKAIFSSSKIKQAAKGAIKQQRDLAGIK